METTTDLHPAFRHQTYLFRKKVLKILGGAFHVYDGSDNLLLYSEQKAFKLREDIRIYADQGKTQELLMIKTPQILDIGATYHVTDSLNGASVGSLKRKGLKSIIRDEWTFLSPQGQELGKLTEASMAMAILSRLVNLVPQSYKIVAGEAGMDRDVAELKQHFNPFVLKYTMTINSPAPAIDMRLMIAAGILLTGIEGRQK